MMKLGDLKNDAFQKFLASADGKGDLRSDRCILHLSVDIGQQVLGYFVTTIVALLEDSSQHQLGCYLSEGIKTLLKIPSFVTIMVGRASFSQKLL